MTRRAIFWSAVALLALWQVVAIVANSSVLPGPSLVATVFVRELGRDLGRHLLVSGYRVVVSMILAGIVAAPLGLAIGQSERLNRLLAPAIYLTYPIPKIVLLPVILLVFGLGDASKIFLIWLILSYQVLLVVRDAAATVRPELVLSVASLGASRRQLLRYVYLPACLPATLTALRVSTGTAIAVLFLSESFATGSGLGYYIMVEGWGRVAYPEMYAGVVAMSVLGFALYLGIDRLERHWCAWLRAGQAATAPVGPGSEGVPALGSRA